MRNSINKTTVLIVLAVFLTISVGYALFSDTITIEGTATAQGNFNVDATCITSLDDEQKNIVFGSTTTTDEGFESENCEVVDDKVTYSVGLKYPGAQKTWLVKFTNTGDIDAKMYAGNSDAFDKHKVSSYNSETDALISDNANTSNYDFVRVAGSFVSKTDGTYVTETDEEIADFIDETGEYIVLKPGESFYVTLTYQWVDYPMFSKNNEYYVIKQNVSVDWMQAVGN